MSELHDDDDDRCYLIRNSGMLGYKNSEIKFSPFLKACVTSMLGVAYSAASIPRSSTSKISAAYGGIGPPGFGRAP